MALETPWLGEYIWEEFTTDGSEPKGVPLPAEVVSMFRPSQCLLCGTVVANNLAAYTHYESKGHFKKVAQHMRETYKVLGVLKSSNDKFKPVRCDICSVDITSRIVYVQHYDGKQHMKNLKKRPYQGPVSLPGVTKGVVDSLPSEELDFENPLEFLKALPPPPPLPKLGAYNCSLCNVNTMSKAQMEIHNNGARHQRNVSKLADGELRDYFLRNGNCEPVVTDAKELIPSPETNSLNPFPQTAPPVEGFTPYSQGMAPFPQPMAYGQYPQSGGYDYAAWYQMQQAYATGPQAYGTGQPPFTSGTPPFMTGQQYPGSQPDQSIQYQNQTYGTGPYDTSTMPQQPYNYNAGQGYPTNNSNFSNSAVPPLVNKPRWKGRHRSPAREPEVRVTPLPDDYKIKSLAVLPFIKMLADDEAKAEGEKLAENLTESADATKDGVEGSSNQDASQCASDNRTSETNVGNPDITASPEKVGDSHPESKLDGDKEVGEASRQIEAKPDETAASRENANTPSQESFKQFKIIGKALGKSRLNSFFKTAAEKKSKDKKMIDDETKSNMQSESTAPEIFVIASKEGSVGEQFSEVKTSLVHNKPAVDGVDSDDLKGTSEATDVDTLAVEEITRNGVEESSSIVENTVMKLPSITEDVPKLEGVEAYDPGCPQNVASIERGDKPPQPQSLADKVFPKVTPLAQEVNHEVKLVRNYELPAESLTELKLPAADVESLEEKLPKGVQSLSKQSDVPVDTVNVEDSANEGWVEKVVSASKTEVYVEEGKKDGSLASEPNVVDKELVDISSYGEKITKNTETKKAPAVGDTNVKETPKNTVVPPQKSSSEVNPKKVSRKKGRSDRLSRSRSSASRSSSASHRSKSRSRSPPPRKASKRLSSSWSPSPEANPRWYSDHKRFDNYGYKNNYNNRPWKNNRGRQNWGYNNRNNWEWEQQRDDSWDYVDERHGRYPDETDEFGRVKRKRSESKKRKEPKKHESRKRKKERRRRRSLSSNSSRSFSRSRSRSKTKSPERKKKRKSKKEVSSSLKSRMDKPSKPVVEPQKVAITQPAILVSKKPQLEEAKRQIQNIQIEKRELLVANKEVVAPPKFAAPLKHTAKPENVQEVQAKLLSPKQPIIDQKQILKALEREKEKHDLLKKAALVKLKLVEREKEKELLKKKKKKKRQKEKSKKKKKRKKASTSSSSSSSSSSDSESSDSSNSSSSTTNSQKVLMAKLLEKLKTDFAEATSSGDLNLSKSEKRKKKKRKKDKKKKTDKESSAANSTSFSESKGGYHCKYCDLTTDSGNAFIQHVVSEKHKLMYKLVKEKMNK